MTTEKMNSDHLGIKHVGKYIAIRNHYKLPNGRVKQSLVMGMLDSVSHAVDYATGTVTSVEVLLSSGSPFEFEMRSVDFYVADELAELITAVASSAQSAIDATAAAEAQD